MEAQNTIIEFTHSHEIKAGSKEWHHKEGFNLGARTQAEISFKAGIKEVVDWLNNNVFELDEDKIIGFLQPTQYFRSEWQAKLKEWGLK